jgi:hypothetical protein
MLGLAMVDHVEQSKRLRLAAKDLAADLTLKVNVVSFEETGPAGADPMALTTAVDFLGDGGKPIGRIEVVTRGKDRERVTTTGALPVVKERDLHPAIRDAARVIVKYVEDRAK